MTATASGNRAFESSYALAEPRLKLLAKELADYVRQLAPSGYLEFAPDSKRWVERPHNFVTIKVQPRARSVAITIAGRPDQHVRYPDIDLKQDRGSYARFTVERTEQLSSAKRLIRAAHDRSL